MCLGDEIGSMVAIVCLEMNYILYPNKICYLLLIILFQNEAYNRLCFPRTLCQLVNNTPIALINNLAGSPITL